MPQLFPHSIIQANSDHFLEFRRNNNSYLFTALTMKLEWNGIRQVYRSTQEFLEFFTGTIVCNGENVEDAPSFWVNFYENSFDSTTPSTNLELIGTMLHAMSHQVFSLKIRGEMVAFSSQRSVQALWQLEKSYLDQVGSTNFLTNNFANRYKLPVISPVPNVESISPNPQGFQQLGVNVQNYHQYF